MTEPWEPSFNFYLAQLDGSAVSFVVDLNAQRLETHPIRLQVRVPLLTPRDDGLRAQAELKPMSDVEDQVVERLTMALDAVYVGRFTTKGETTFVFYVPETSRAKLEGVPHFIGDLERYTFQYLTAEDPSWSFYTEFLYPDPYALQGILNRTLVDSMASNGDQLSVPRELDHLALFKTPEAALAAGETLRAKGYRVDPLPGPDEQGIYALEFHRRDPLSGERPDEVVVEILDVVLPLEGKYDGWGCALVRN